MAVLTPTGPTTPIVGAVDGTRTLFFTGGACGPDDTIKIATGTTANVTISYVEVNVTGGGVTRVDPEFHKVGTGLSAATRRAKLLWSSDVTPDEHLDGAIVPFRVPVDSSGDVYLRPQPNGTGTAYDVTIVVGGGVR